MFGPSPDYVDEDQMSQIIRFVKVGPLLVKTAVETSEVIKNKLGENGSSLLGSMGQSYAHAVTMTFIHADATKALRPSTCDNHSLHVQEVTLAIPCLLFSSPPITNEVVLRNT